MTAAVASDLQYPSARRVWVIVLIVTLLHLFGAALYKYGLPVLFPKQKSEITIELGGSVLRGDRGEGVRQASQVTKPTPAKHIIKDDGALKRRAPAQIQQAAPASVDSPTTSESSGTAGIQAAASTDADYKAAYLNNPKPPYPAMAHRMHIEGTVMLKALVQPDGSCGDVLLAKSSGNELLDRSALNTVAQWKFIPAKSQGKDIAQWVSIPISFSIKRR